MGNCLFIWHRKRTIYFHGCLQAAWIWCTNQVSVWETRQPFSMRQLRYTTRFLIGQEPMTWFIASINSYLYNFLPCIIWWVLREDKPWSRHWKPYFLVKRFTASCNCFTNASNCIFYDFTGIINLERGFSQSNSWTGSFQSFELPPYNSYCSAMSHCSSESLSYGRIWPRGGLNFFPRVVLLTIIQSLNTTFNALSHSHSISAPNEINKRPNKFQVIKVTLVCL